MRVVSKALRKERIYYKPAHSARDLGVSYTAGVRHRDANQIIRNRYIKTNKRSCKIGRLLPDSLEKRAANSLGFLRQGGAGRWL